MWTDGNRSALDPHGPSATEIAELAWLLFAGGAAIFLLVIGWAVLAIWGPPGIRARLAGTRAIVAGGVVFPLVALTALLVRAFVPEGFGDPGAAVVRIEVTGEQWWWRVHYLDAEGATEFATANEIRVPVGQTVELSLRSADVIHSFWVPSLAGKVDMVPGRTLSLRLSADRTGTFHGQCAEYCGGPHARMALSVIAESAEAFETWRARQRAHGNTPGRDAPERGHSLFLTRGCGVCHTIRGTEARGTRGPDLTDVGGRLSLGAGTLSGGADGLARWIAANQQVKPGNLMPSYAFLSTEELRTIAGYLEGLR